METADLGKQLKLARLTRGETQSQVALAAGVGLADLSRIERGEQVPRADTLGRLARAVGLDLQLRAPAVMQMPPPIAVGFLDLAAVAAALGLKTTLPAQRLIALRLLQAVRLGENGPWRVAAGEVESYIGKGAPALAFPETGEAFVRDSVAKGGAFMAAAGVKAALWAELAPDTEPPPDNVPVEGPLVIRPSAAVLAAFRRPMAAVRGKPPRIPTVGVAHLVNALQMAARDEVARRKREEARLRSGAQGAVEFDPLGHLYRDPQTCSAILTAAREAVLAPEAGMHFTHMWTDLGVLSGYRIMVRNVELATAAEVEQAVALAF
ncbi:MAG TPA: helix-turn-helix transcriptional regulator [Phycisphaerae bacterium]|nr:helix-turn-helix transcriptional regulator [Phycisphaerae bacterium]